MRSPSKRLTPEAKLGRELLLFAIKQIERATDELVYTYTDFSKGRITPKRVANEVKANQRWLRRARKAVRA